MPVATIVTTEEEAEGLVRWAQLFSSASGEEALHILYRPEVSDKNLRQYLKAWEEEGHATLSQVELMPFDGSYSLENLLKVVSEIGPEYLILGQNRSSSSEKNEESLTVNRSAFEKAICNTILLRLGSGRLQDCDSVLIPTAGGPHSSVALQLGSQIAKRFGGQITPLFVEANIGEEDGQAVGKRILDRVLRQAGVDALDTEHVRKEVRLSDHIGSAVVGILRERHFDLVIIGASNSLSVKRKLFGVIPSKMIEGDTHLTVAVIRRKVPIQHRLREKAERFLTLRIPQLERTQRVALFDRLQTQSNWSFDFVLLMLLSTGIASLGLIQSSPAVVIGAMLVAPLMTPLLGSGLALVQGNLPLIKSCLKSICFGFLAALLVGVLFGSIAPISVLTSELAARGGPNLLDFGVAAISGIAASYCVARPGLSSALAGVAIAAALVPPIATVGISLALREFGNASGAALLFGTNVIAIILSSALTFFLIGIRGQLNAKTLWAHRTIILLSIAMAMLLIPLSTVLLSSSQEAHSWKAKNSELLEKTLRDQLSTTGLALRRVSIQSATSDQIEYHIESDKLPQTGDADTIADIVKEKLNLPEKPKVLIRSDLVTESISSPE